MIKRISLVVAVCLPILFSPNAIAEPYLSDSTKQKYLEWIKEIRQISASKHFLLRQHPMVHGVQVGVAQLPKQRQLL